jgi:hypothetical protein
LPQQGAQTSTLTIFRNLRPKKRGQFLYRDTTIARKSQKLHSHFSMACEEYDWLCIASNTG